jgi:ATP-dependent protease HslVU (ClpYQ) ATPase subunit
MTHRSSGSLEDYISSRKRTMQKTESFKKSLKISELESDKIRLELEKKKMIEIAEALSSENQKLLLEIERLKANLTQQS